MAVNETIAAKGMIAANKKDPERRTVAIVATMTATTEIERGDHDCKNPTVIYLAALLRQITVTGTRIVERGVIEAGTVTGGGAIEVAREVVTEAEAGAGRVAASSSVAPRQRRRQCGNTCRSTFVSGRELLFFPSLLAGVRHWTARFEPR